MAPGTEGGSAGAGGSAGEAGTHRVTIEPLLKRPLAMHRERLARREAVRSVIEAGLILGMFIRMTHMVDLPQAYSTGETHECILYALAWDWQPAGVARIRQSQVSRRPTDVSLKCQYHVSVSGVSAACQCQPRVSGVTLGCQVFGQARCRECAVSPG